MVRMTAAPPTQDPTKEPPAAELRGTLRDCTPQGKGLGRLGEGDIVFVDAPDMQRRLAEQIIARRPAAVVNLARTPWTPACPPRSRRR